MSKTTTENMKTLRTVIKTRQGTTSEWEQSNLILEKGELGLEYVEKLGKDGKTWTATGDVKIKAGDGEHTFFPKYDITDPTKVTNEGLPYIGSDVKQSNVLQNSTILSATDDSDDVNTVIQSMITAEGLNEDTIQAGDVAIVKRYIDKVAEGSTSTKISYTSYVYDPEIVIPDTYVVGTNADGSPIYVTAETKYLYKWRAMDGNYSASNVFLKNSIKNTTGANIGYFEKDKTKPAGTSLESLLSSMFQKELNPSAVAPTASISTSGGSGEVGSPYSAPKATLKIDSVGYYKYSDNTTSSVATGVKFTSGNVVLAEGADPSKATNKTSNSSDMGKGNTIELTASAGGTYEDTSKTYTFSGTAHYEAGTNTPQTNLGNDYASAKISAGDVTITDKTATFSGWRGSWYGTLDLTETVNKFTTTDSDSSAAEQAAASYAIKNYTGVKKYNGEKFTVGNADTNSKKITSGIAATGKAAVFVVIKGEKKVSNIELNYFNGLGNLANYAAEYPKNIITEYVMIGGADASQTDIGDYATKYTVIYICADEKKADGSIKGSKEGAAFGNYTFQLKVK